MKNYFCIAYKTSFIKAILDSDPNIYGLIFRKPNTSNKVTIWELSPKIFNSFIEPVVTKDEDVKWAYVDKNNSAIFDYPNDDTLPSNEYHLQFFETIPDLVLFRRENLLSLLRKSDDNYLYISGAKIDYGLGRNDFRTASKSTEHTTLKAETQFIYTEKDKDEVYWKVDFGMPCPPLWEGAVAELMSKIVANELVTSANESFTENGYGDFPKETTVKDALNQMINKLKNVQE